MHILEKISAPETDAPVALDMCEVLVIDDDADFSAEVVELLTGLGYTCTAAATALEGLSLIVENPAIGLVLCDYRLPDMEGFEFSRELVRIHGKTRALSLIMVSGFSSMDLVLEALRLGVDDFLTKPIKPGDLARALRDGIEAWRVRARVLARQQEWARQSASPAPSAEAGLILDGGKSQVRKFDEQGNASALNLIDLLLLVRRERERLLQKDIYGDPAWEISLELMKMRMANKPIPVSSACTASNAPLTTSLRWIRNMEKLGLLRRWDDPKDKRRDLIEMSEDYGVEMSELLESVIKKWNARDYG